MRVSNRASNIKLLPRKKHTLALQRYRWMPPLEKEWRGRTGTLGEFLQSVVKPYKNRVPVIYPLGKISGLPVYVFYVRIYKTGERRLYINTGSSRRIGVHIQIPEGVSVPSSVRVLPDKAIVIGVQ